MENIPGSMEKIPGSMENIPGSMENIPGEFQLVVLLDNITGIYIYVCTYNYK
jgi:hypothetical protein